jgi:hypothetical protein
MKLKLVLVLTALLLIGSGAATAKYMSRSLTIDGPGIAEPLRTKNQGFINRVYVSILDVQNPVRVEPPSRLGAGYVLEFGFVVGDYSNQTPRIARVGQILYPFSADGPIVRTPTNEFIDTSFGPVRFPSGWFRVPDRIVEKLERLGLPQSPPESSTAPAAGVVTAAPGVHDPADRSWAWLVIAAIPLLGAGWLKVARRSR